MNKLIKKYYVRSCFVLKNEKKKKPLEEKIDRTPP